MDDTTIFLFLNGELNSQEQAEVIEWKKTNDQEFNRIKLIWENAETEPIGIILDESSAWEKINPENRRTEKPKTKLLSTWLKYAAAILILFSVSLFAYNSLQPEWIEYASTGKEMKVIELPDGSSVSLNRDSKLLYKKHVFGKLRETILYGEAFFEVQKNPDKPFVVSAGETEIRVLGTSFNINANKPGYKVVVSVITGKVSFTEKKNPQNMVLLAAEDEGVYSAKQKKLIIQEPDLNSLAWKSRSLLFKSTPINEVYEILSEYFDTNIFISQAAIGNEKLTARYSDKSLSEILQLLELTLEIESRQCETGIELYSRSGEHH